MGGLCCVDLSGSILTFRPDTLLMLKGKEHKSFGPCLVMQLHANRIAYDACTWCNFCCLCGSCRGVLAFSHIHTMEENGNDITIVMKDGWKIDIVGLQKDERHQIINTFSENTAFLP
eukprot:250039_1